MHKVFMFLLFYLFTVALTSDKKYKAGFRRMKQKVLEFFARVIRIATAKK